MVAASHTYGCSLGRYVLQLGCTACGARWAAAYLQLLGGAAAEDAGWRARLTMAGDAHASDGVDDLRETKGCG